MTKILDCTFRDGGYYTNWTFDKQMVYESVKALDKAKIDYIELGYKSPGKGGPYKKCNEKFIRDVLQEKPTAKLSFMIDLKEFVKDETFQEKLFYELIKPSKNSWFDMCRVAFNYEYVNYVPKVVACLTKLKYEVGLNFMQIDLLTEQQMSQSIPVLKRIDKFITYFYVPDTFST